MPDNDELQKWQNTNIDVLKHQKAICLLISGHSVTEICKELSVSNRTLQRWFNYPEFNQNLSKAIRFVFQSSLAKAAIYADKALDLLMEIAESKDEPTRYRLQAIAQITDIAFKAGLHEERTELSEIESKMNYEKKLLSSYGSVRMLSNDIGKDISQPLLLDNQRAIWEELYPDTPYPDK
jgi:hypothetical protein